jgi:S-formylglutathione hydrolase FrmB
MKKLLVIILFSVIALKVCASDVVTSEFIGNKTGIKHPVTVILPTSYDKSQKYNVIYVLHGYSGNHADWTTATDIETLADQFNVIIVNPDGGYDSWYIDSKIKKKSIYETYIAKDIVNYIDQHYSTNSNRNGRAITGLSMGGFGALHVAINNQDVFGAVGAMSAGVDLRPFSAEFGIEKVLGKYSDLPDNWTSVAIINNLHKIAAGNTQWSKGEDTLPIMLDIGVSDFFLPFNRQLHQAMLDLRVPHDYVERPGGHDWDYWSNAIVYQFQFLTNHLAH